MHKEGTRYFQNCIVLPCRSLVLHLKRSRINFQFKSKNIFFAKNSFSLSKCFQIRSYYKNDTDVFFWGAKVH